jgi:hypothetical protein
VDPILWYSGLPKHKSKLKLYYDRRSAGQSVLEQSTHLGLTTRSWLFSDSCGFDDLGRPLWREDGSAVCNCYWPSPAQSFSGPSPVGLVAIFYCRRFETSFFVASLPKHTCLTPFLSNNCLWLISKDLYTSSKWIRCTGLYFERLTLVWKIHSEMQSENLKVRKQVGKPRRRWDYNDESYKNNRMWGCALDSTGREQSSGNAERTFGLTNSTTVGFCTAQPHGARYCVLKFGHMHRSTSHTQAARQNSWFSRDG